MQAFLKLLQPNSPQFSTNTASAIRMVVVVVAALSSYLAAHASVASGDPTKTALIVALATAVSHWAMEYLSGTPANSTKPAT